MRALLLKRRGMKAEGKGFPKGSRRPFGRKGVPYREGMMKFNKNNKEGFKKEHV